MGFWVGFGGGETTGLGGFGGGVLGQPSQTCPAGLCPTTPQHLRQAKPRPPPRSHAPPPQTLLFRLRSLNARGGPFCVSFDAMNSRAWACVNTPRDLASWGFGLGFFGGGGFGGFYGRMSGGACVGVGGWGLGALVEPPSPAGWAAACPTFACAPAPLYPKTHKNTPAGWAAAAPAAPPRCPPAPPPPGRCPPPSPSWPR